MTGLRAIATLLLTLAAFSLAGCGGGSKSKPLTDDVLNNLAYPLDLGGGSGPVQLKDGKFSQTNPGGFGMSMGTLLDKRATGRIDGDKTPDAAVILAHNGGGSGTFYNLFAVLNKKGAPQVSKPMLLGDRVVINSIQIEDRQIVISMRVQGPQDPFCCPTKEITARYALRGDSLEAVSN